MFSGFSPLQAWAEFLFKGIHESCVEPCFYQHVTDLGLVFQKIINLRQGTTIQGLGQVQVHKRKLMWWSWAHQHRSKCISRYLAGYVHVHVCHKIQNTLEKKNLKLLFPVSDMLGCEIDENNHSESRKNMLDRGGLCNVSDSTYHLFLSTCIELQVRKYFTLDKAVLGQTDVRELTATISDNQAVIHHWKELIEHDEKDLSVEEARSVLSNIVKLIRLPEDFPMPVHW